MHFARLVPIIALGAASLAAAADENPSEVLSLTGADFESEVNAEGLILVEFFAPWCGHCKALAPHYDEASITLKDKGIKLAKVDCVDQADLCQQHGVSGYPTLKVFRNGTPTDYTGPRKADGIVSYMVKQSLPAVSKVTETDFDEFKKADKMVLIAFLESESEAPAEEFTATAEAHRDDFLFGMTTDAALIKSAGVSTPSIILFRSFDEPEMTYSFPVKSATKEDLENFLQSYRIPILDEVSQENYGVYAASGLPLAYLFINPEDDKKDEYSKIITPIAKKHRGKMNFVTIDAVKFVDHAKALGVDVDHFPAFVIQDLNQQLKFPLSHEKGVGHDALSDWVNDYLANKLEPVLKSEPIPESQDESVYTLVGKAFDEVVFDDEKDVFVEFYAPWCGHCKRLKPTWDSLGDRYAGLKNNIIIAKMDATENDLPASVPFRVSGFPTLKFKPAGSRDFIDYDGDRSLESLIEFVESKATNKLDVKPAVASPKVELTDDQIPIGDKHDEL